MRRILLLAVVLVPLVGCGKKHPAKIYVDDQMNGGSIEKIAVFPFASALHHSDDPDGVAPKMMDMLFRKQLDNRRDYRFVAPTSVTYALERGGMEGQGEAFVARWIKSREVDAEFLARLGEALGIDAVMIGVVEVWQKDEVDIQEDATPATYVGASLTILSIKDGSILFRASDEDFLEGARSETSDRSVIRSPTGKIYSDPRGRLFRAPPYEDVAAKVVMALVGSIPVR